ncbi:MAG TPA: DUF1259 domain-containing protein [Armatimonadota bacterium]
MKTFWMTGSLVLLLIGAVLPGMTQAIPQHYQAVLTSLGKQGDYADNVLKINLPRNDINVTVDNVAVPTAFGFGGWVAMTKDDQGMEVMMGDLVLLQEEVNPVITSLQEHGLEVTALHNHFFWDTPRIFYLHVHGHGKALDLAHAVKPAIDLMGNVPPYPGGVTVPAGTKLPAGPLDTAALVRIIGHTGQQSGEVYKVTIGRNDIKLMEHGAPITSRMGLNTWAAFIGSNDDAMIAGDVAMLESEVNPVVAALRQHGLQVVAIHNHMIGDRPVIIFLHYQGRGPATQLATGFKAAINALGKHPAR